jgi:hypothetical protein
MVSLVERVGAAGLGWDELGADWQAARCEQEARLEEVVTALRKRLRKRGTVRKIAELLQRLAWRAVLGM